MFVKVQQVEKRSDYAMQADATQMRPAQQFRRRAKNAIEAPMELIYDDLESTTHKSPVPEAELSDGEVLKELAHPPAPGRTRGGALGPPLPTGRRHRLADVTGDSLNSPQACRAR